MRYTDEGETTELCKWTVDLSSLPTFRQNASLVQSGGFYTGKQASLPVQEIISNIDCPVEFEIGLEMDSAEVRGTLLYNGQEWGKLVLLASPIFMTAHAAVSLGSHSIS